MTITSYTTESILGCFKISSDTAIVRTRPSVSGTYFEMSPSETPRAEQQIDAKARGLFSGKLGSTLNQSLKASDEKVIPNGYYKQFLYFLGAQVTSARLQFKLIG